MRIALPILATLVLAASAAAQPAAKPTLAFTGMEPVTLRGTNFRPNERVVIVSSTPKTAKVVVRTNAAGTFRATIKLTYDRCAGLSVGAFAPGGEHAATAIGTIGCNLATISAGPVQ